MAYDTELESRIDLLSLNWPGFAKKRMFGGIGYLLQGNMAFGVLKELLIVRCGAEDYEYCLTQPHTRPFDITGKAMIGWVCVDTTSLDNDDALLAWLERGRNFAATLPPK